MNYNVVSRPKLARNKYGEVEKVAGVSGTSYFSGTSQSGDTSSNAQIDTFKGSTATEDGIQGLVPAPKCNVNEPLGSLNDNKKFLKGTGAWVDIPISRYTSETPNHDGIKLEGNLHVTDTLSTQTLNVTGAAHFWELVIDKVRSTSGNLLITPANFHVDMVGEDIEYPVDPDETPYVDMFYDEDEETGIYGLAELFESNNIDSMTATRLYMRNDNGNMNTVPTMEIGDMVRCKTFNVDDLGTHNIHNKDYWTFVMNVGTETVDDISYIYIDVFKEYTADGVTYGLGTTINSGSTISHNSVTPLRARALVDNFVPMSRERMLAVDEIDTTESGEYYVGNSTTIPSGTTLSADVMTSDGTVYSAGTTLANELILDRGDIVILDGTNDLTSFGSDIEFTSGESEVLATGNEGATNTVSSETSVNSADIAIEEFTFGYGTFEPAEGDDIVALGHLWSGDRQDAILIAACDPMDAELTPPAIAQYRGIKTFESLSKYRTNTLSAGGNEFTGRFLVDYNGYYIDINEKLNIFSADLTSGLEKVGIHLDGENSTIKLVGSVEIRQNHDGTTDTLTVWDEDDKLRVQISPDEIPAKADISSSINPTYNSYFNSISGMRYPTDGATWERHTYTEFIWSWDHEWQYYVASESSSSSPAYFRFTTTDSLGNYNAGEKITLDDYWADISTVAYFKGSTRMTNRGTNQQSISSVILRFQCNRGSGWATISSFNLTNSATINLWDEFVSIEYNNMLLNNYTLPYTGAYRVEMEIVYNVYASIVFKGKSGKQSNPYILFNCGVRGGLNVISPSNSMTRIGSNGILFNTSNTGQYFYSGNDGIEMKWGDVGVCLDQYGYRRYKKVYTVATDGSSSSRYGYSIPLDADVIFVTGQYVQINTHAWAGIPEGKEIIVVGNDDGTTTYGTANTYTSNRRKHFIYHSQEWWEI